MLELKYKRWEDITLRKFNELEKILLDNEMSDIDKNSSLLAVLCDCSIDEIESIDYADYIRLNAESNFIKNVPTIDIRDKYTINGREYELCTDFKKYSTIQFIDFQMLAKDKQKNKHRIIAIFLVPPGAKYGDGSYDIEQVVNDVLDMPILDADACMLFFSIVYNALTIAILKYSKRQMKRKIKREKNKKKRELMIEGIMRTEQVLHLLKNGIG